MPQKKAMFYSTTTVFLAATTLTSSVSVAALISASIGGIPISDAVYENFNNLSSSGGLSSKGIYVTFNGIDSGTAALPDVSGKYAAPYVVSASDHLFNDIPQEDGSDLSQYLATGIGAVTLDLNAYHQYFGLLWGSVDSYNILSFYDGNTLLFSYTGLDVTRLPNGDRGANGTFYVNITSDIKFNKVIASSPHYSFEFDNVALVNVGTSSQEIQQIPEPSTLALLGFGLLAGSITHRKKWR